MHRKLCNPLGLTAGFIRAIWQQAVTWSERRKINQSMNQPFYVVTQNGIIWRKEGRKGRGMFQGMDAHERGTYVWTAQKSVTPKTLTAVIPRSVTLRCRTSLGTPASWYYVQSENETETERLICRAGNIVNDYRRRFSLDRSGPGYYSLVIASVTRADAGVYICREESRLGVEDQRVHLSVQGKW